MVLWADRSGSMRGSSFSLKVVVLDLIILRYPKLMDRAIENAIATSDDSAHSEGGVALVTDLLTLSLPHSRHQVSSTTSVASSLVYNMMLELT